MKVTLKTLGLALLAAIVLSLAAWFWLVLHQFDFAHPMTGLPDGLLHTFSYPSLRPIAWQSLFFGFATIGILLYALGDWDGSGERVLRGSRVVRGAELANRTRIRRTKDAAPVQVEMAGVPLPLACETGHFLLVGSTGTGKSTGIDELLSFALARGDRCIVVDPDGHALSSFAKKGDTVLNPFDRRSPGWCLFNEIRGYYDYERLAKSVVSDAADAANQQWHAYAQRLLADIMETLAQGGETTTERLVYWATQASAEQLGSFLTGTASAGLFQPGSEKPLSNTRFIITHYIGPYKHLRPGDFSLRDWLESGTGNLYLTWREDMMDSLRPLISGWVDILMAAILILPTQGTNRLWLVLDELGGLEHLNSLEDGLTRGRKHGLRVVAGLQATSQLEKRYGRDSAQTLRSCFRSLLALGCSNADPDTAEAISKGLGQAEIERTQVTYNSGPTGTTTSSHTQRGNETLVLPSELMGLPPLHGFLALAGDNPVARVQLVPRDLPMRNKPFVER
ncbi:type IV secretion system DNA-binding domain-containing protein [Methylovorus mays]|uniref:type IV secretion system DNA-binding domain-containing protein n=1 Tax=Methylovorus mays TaxID=184077 RepID=UPI001E63AE46|nr:type IV secretion system DNA-binding domain-containing protein [Methylovorus mays]MCB5207710.1 type IV secretion system DNA-binding domain-containing protein [Methylovorus mays]